jgi:hypothetical protein
MLYKYRCCSAAGTAFRSSAVAFLNCAQQQHCAAYVYALQMPIMPGTHLGYAEAVDCELGSISTAEHYSYTDSLQPCCEQISAMPL